MCPARGAPAHAAYAENVPDFVGAEASAAQIDRRRASKAAITVVTAGVSRNPSALVESAISASTARAHYPVACAGIVQERRATSGARSSAS